MWTDLIRKNNVEMTLMNIKEKVEEKGEW